MYIINKDDNRINRVKEGKFSELGFRERDHLQEWLAYNPEALGEELLIIQKEFDGFDETRERLDILALDKNGNLVIVENKLDDTGRDVVWQALKYASYCASLTKSQIVEIYQQYLNKYSSGADASSSICDFLEVPDLDEIKINSGNNQRIFFVAANYRKEVTTTVLWLIGQGIDIKCLKVTPFILGNDYLLNIEQIIPTPEAQEMMIGISAKEAEEKRTEVKIRKSHTLRLKYWEKLLDVLRNSECNLFDNISATKDHWLSSGSGVSRCKFEFNFNKNEIRVLLTLAKYTPEENKEIFDKLYQEKESIEALFGHPLNWQRLDNKKSSIIMYSTPTESFNEEKWDEMIEWHLEYIIKLEKALKEPLNRVVGK